MEKRNTVTGMPSLDQEIATISCCLREELLSEVAPVDEAHALPSLAADGHWPDIDCANLSRTHWLPAQHTARIALLTRAHHQPETPLSGSEKVALANPSNAIPTHPTASNRNDNPLHTAVRHFSATLKRAWDRVLHDLGYQGEECREQQRAARPTGQRDLCHRKTNSSPIARNATFDERASHRVGNIHRPTNRSL